jgi:hypothetical protein
MQMVEYVVRQILPSVASLISVVWCGHCDCRASRMKGERKQPPVRTVRHHVLSLTMSTPFPGLTQRILTAWALQSDFPSRQFLTESIIIGV